MEEEQQENLQNIIHEFGVEIFDYFVLDENDIVINCIRSSEENADPTWMKDNPEEYDTAGRPRVGCKYVRSKHYFLQLHETEEMVNQILQERLAIFLQAKQEYEPVINSYIFKNTLSEELQEPYLKVYESIIDVIENHEQYPYKMYGKSLSIGVLPLPTLNLENEV